MLVRLFAMPMGGGGVLLGLVMLAHAVMVSGRMVVMSRSRVMGGGLMMGLM